MFEMNFSLSEQDSWTTPFQFFLIDVKLFSDSAHVACVAVHGMARNCPFGSSPSQADTRLCRTDVPASSRGQKGAFFAQFTCRHPVGRLLRMLLEMCWNCCWNPIGLRPRTSPHLRGVAEAGRRSDATPGTQRLRRSNSGCAGVRWACVAWQSVAKPSDPWWSFSYEILDSPPKTSQKHQSLTGHGALRHVLDRLAKILFN